MSFGPPRDVSELSSVKEHAETPVKQHIYLFADPVAHSRSPQMHRAAFDFLGFSPEVAEYTPYQLATHELAQALTMLRETRALGANLSLPHKESALCLVDECSDAAQKIGAINTIVQHRGHLRGENTDAQGLLLALKQDDLLPRHGHVVVLGAGGAARAAVYMLRCLLPEPLPVQLINRHFERAEQLAAEWTTRDRATHGNAPHSNAADKNVTDQNATVEATTAETCDWSSVSLIINASSAGLDTPNERPLPDFDLMQFTHQFFRSPRRAKYASEQEQRLDQPPSVYDMVYQPEMTRLRRDAEAAGLKHAGGLSMLAQQARLSFELWTQQKVPYQVFWQALMESA